MSRAGRFKGLVVTGFGINCDYETAHALASAGFTAERAHLNELVAGAKRLTDYHLLVVDGGFAWADDHGAGVLLALRIKTGIGEELKDFVAKGRLVLGICNGFQALVNLGILPALEGVWKREVALIANDCGNFRNDWVRLTFEANCPSVFTEGLASLDLPVRHGEGKLYAEARVLDRIEAAGLVAARYADADGVPAGGRFPANPNGSLHDIAALSDLSGRVLGIMPHPEAFHHLTNHPHWPRLADAARREGRELDWRGGGLALFEKAREYLEANF